MPSPNMTWEKRKIRNLHAPVRLTESTKKVLMLIYDNPGGVHGYEIYLTTGLSQSLVYPILKRLEARGWVESWWRDPAVTTGRNARKYYDLTTTGIDNIESKIINKTKNKDQR